MKLIMEIAYLISVHKDPSQFKRMVKALDNGHSHFFVHVDAKANQENFTPPPCKNITFCKTRYYIQWGGFNQVKYQFEILKTCIESGLVFDRIFILTGQDYPLWNNAEIESELCNNPNKEYITGLNISNLKKPSKILSKITLYHFFRDIEKVPYKIKKIFSGSSRLLMRLLPIRKKPYIIINEKQWNIWQASGYMCLTWNCACHVLHEMKCNIKLMNYFRYSFAPDEMVIPTIIFNSPYKENASVYPYNRYDGLKSLSAITYFNYGKAIQVFKLEDYAELKRSGKMFARKFESGISDSLIEKLNNNSPLSSSPSTEQV